MKKIMLTLLVGLLALSSYAQVLPKPSPKGEVEQIVGVTELELEYSRPGVKDRVIFGGLLSYGELWRLGANASTKFTTEHPLTFGDKELKAGTYALLAIPNENGTWEIIFNNDLEGGTADYDKAKDALRVMSKAQVGAFTETLTLGFDNVKNNSANLVMLWENLRVEVPFEVDSDKFARLNIAGALKKGEDLGSVYNEAANYFYSTVGDNQEALKLVDASIGIEEGYRNLFLKARILEESGKKTAAIILANKALKLAQEAGSKGYSNFISGTLDRWKK